MVKPLLDLLLKGRLDNTIGTMTFHPAVGLMLSWLDGTKIKLGRFTVHCLEQVKLVLSVQQYLSKPVQNITDQVASAVLWMLRKDDTSERLAADDGTIEKWCEVKRWFNVICTSQETKELQG